MIRALRNVSKARLARAFAFMGLLALTPRGARAEPAWAACGRSWDAALAAAGASPLRRETFILGAGAVEIVAVPRADRECVRISAWTTTPDARVSLTSYAPHGEALARSGDGPLVSIVRCPRAREPAAHVVLRGHGAEAPVELRVDAMPDGEAPALEPRCAALVPSPGAVVVSFGRGEDDPAGRLVAAVGAELEGRGFVPLGEVATEAVPARAVRRIEWPVETTRCVAIVIARERRGTLLVDGAPILPDGEARVRVVGQCPSEPRRPRVTVAAGAEDTGFAVRAWSLPESAAIDGIDADVAFEAAIRLASLRQRGLVPTAIARTLPWGGARVPVPVPVAAGECIAVVLASTRSGAVVELSLADREGRLFGRDTGTTAAVYRCTDADATWVAWVRGYAVDVPVRVWFGRNP